MKCFFYKIILSNELMDHNACLAQLDPSGMQSMVALNSTDVANTYEDILRSDRELETHGSTSMPGVGLGLH